MLVYFGSFTGEILNLENQAMVKNTKYYILAKKGVDHKETLPHKKKIFTLHTLTLESFLASLTTRDCLP